MVLMYRRMVVGDAFCYVSFHISEVWYQGRLLCVPEKTQIENFDVKQALGQRL